MDLIKGRKLDTIIQISLIAGIQFIFLNEYQFIKDRRREIKLMNGIETLSRSNQHIFRQLSRFRTKIKDFFAYFFEKVFQNRVDFSNSETHSLILSLQISLIDFFFFLHFHFLAFYFFPLDQKKIHKNSKRGK